MCGPPAEAQSPILLIKTLGTPAVYHYLLLQNCKLKEPIKHGVHLK